jgi:chemotaxis protein MotB
VSGGGGHGGGGKRRGHEEEHEEHENHERWLVSYADMMTLLMVLFIVMFAISQVDQKKFMALKTGLSAGFGAPVAMLNGADAMLQVGGSVAPDSVNLSGSAGGPKAPEIATTSVNPEAVAELQKATEKAAVAKEVGKLKKAQEELKKALAKAGLKDAANFRFDERGLVVTIATDKVLFVSGDATLSPEGRRILATIAPTLKSLPNRLSVDGHTNSIPISTERFPSNWELSTDRATGVLRFLASSQGIPADRMYATGFADTKPLVKKSDPRANVRNRRVEIVVLAALDNAAGRAVATLGNSPEAAAPETSGTASGTSSGTSSGAESSGSTATGTAAH